MENRKSNDIQIIELCCNVDDMSGEAIAYAVEKLMNEGACDVSWMPVGMKKGRPGVFLMVLCKPEDRDKMLHLIFKHTSTIGVRETLCRKHLLRSELGFVESVYGPISVKKSAGYGVERIKAEFDDLKRIADENNLSIEEIRRTIQ